MLKNSKSMLSLTNIIFTVKKLIGTIMCRFGVHGPDMMGSDSQLLSQFRPATRNGFVRECRCCGQRWYGEEVVFCGYTRTLGNWKTEKQLIESGEWVDDKSAC